MFLFLLLSPVCSGLLKHVLAFFPVRHQHGQKTVKTLGMVRMNEMTQLMHDNVLNAVLRSLQQSRVQRDDALFCKAGAPSGFHIPNSQGGTPNTILCKQGIQLIERLRKYHNALTMEETLDKALSPLQVIRILHTQINVTAVRMYGLSRGHINL